MRRVFTGLGALIFSAVLLVGLPAALVFLAGNPIPSIDRLVQAFTMPDYGGEFLIGTVIPIAAWIAWGTFALGYLAEIPNQLRQHRRTTRTRSQSSRVRVPGLGMQQKAAGVLIAAILAIFVPTGAYAATAAPVESVSAISAVSTTTSASETPADKTPDTTQTEEDQTERVIRSGDTLWSIAEDEYGEGERYTEIFEASTSIAQPGGERLTDPDLILPGWTVDIPSATSAPAASTQPASSTEEQTQDSSATATGSEEAPAPVAEDAAAADEDTSAQDGSGLGYVTEDTGSSSASGDASTSEQEAPTVDSSGELTAEEGADWVDIVTDWRTLGGVGGVLAAGLLSLLGWRRLQQRRNRKPGQKIAMPAEDIGAVELELRAVETPTDMDAVDHALRLLAVWAQDTGTQLPALYALRLGEDEISVFLNDPARLPAPFTATSDDDMAWSIDTRDLTPLERIPSAPYPALVTIGRDENDARLLVDLERLGALNVQGDHDLEQAALRAIALELATTTWGENLQVTLVGVGKELPDAFGASRLRYVEDTETLLRNLRGQATAVTESLEAEGLTSLEEARTARPDAESWTPEIVILGEMPDAQIRDELSDLVTRIPRVGVAAIAAGHLAGGWNLHVTGPEAADLEIADAAGAVLPLVPQLVTDEDYQRILGLFTVANNDNGIDHTQASPEIDIDEISETITDEATEDTSPDEQHVTAEELEQVAPAGAEPSTDITVTNEDTSAGSAEAAPADENVPELAPVTAAADETLEAPVAAVDAEETAPAADLIDLHTPRVQLLGPVSVLHVQGETPTSEKGIKQWNSQVLRATELVAYLATHPHANTDQVHSALWPGVDPARGTQSRNGLTTKTRRWLGQDAAGSPYLPPAKNGIYTLHDTMTSDWDEWLDLIGDDPAHAPTAALEKALHLVKGQPISGVKEKYYAWAEPLRAEMISSVADAAHELATRALHEGSVRNARMASAIGRMVEPENEVHWRDALRAEHMAGDHTGIDRLIVQLERALAQIDPEYAEMEPETEELIEQLRGRRALAG